jgi:hypothetical protein
MSHFTLQLGPNGPIVSAVIFVSQQRQAALTAAGQPIPAHVTAQALVDTGASCTCVEAGLIASLNLQVLNMVPVNTPTTGTAPQSVPQYDVQLVIPGATLGAIPLVFPTIPIVALPNLGHQQGFQVLIGRDILDQCILHYNGAARFFTIAF